MEPRYDHSNVSANTRRCMFDQTISRNPRFSRHEILIRGNAARGEKNSKKICLSEIIFLVALSRSGWNFNNHFVDFPGEPLERAAFAKKRKKKEKEKQEKRQPFPIAYFPVRAAPHFHFDISAGKTANEYSTAVRIGALCYRRVYFNNASHCSPKRSVLLFLFFFQDTLANCLAASVIYSPNEASCSLKNNTEDQSL